MKDVDRHALALSAGLASLAGFVDAVGFLDTGGLFVSFMSGTSTQAAVGAGTDPVVAVVAAGVIASFVIGVAAGAVVGARTDRARAGVVAGSALAVGVAAALALAGPVTLWRVGLLAAAMGALNTLFLAEGRARVAITYVTGTLVSLGLALAAALTGRSRTAWRRPLLLWAALVAGAFVGGAAHGLGSPAALGIAAVAMAGTAGVLAVRRPRPGRS